MVWGWLATLIKNCHNSHVTDLPITIKVKVDLKKAGQNKLDDLMDELEMIPHSPQPEVSEADIFVNTLLNIAILETEINVAIPVRILYKRPSKSKSVLGLAF